MGNQRLTRPKTATTRDRGSVTVCFRPVAAGRFSPKQTFAALLDHLVGAKQQVLHRQPECLRGLHVDNELELRGLLDG